MANLEEKRGLAKKEEKGSLMAEPGLMMVSGRRYTYGRTPKMRLKTADNQPFS